MYLCNRCWNFLAVVRLVAPNPMCLGDYRQMGQNPMDVNRNRCLNCCLKCYAMYFLMDDDLSSRYSLDNRWCCTRVDRYLDLRFCSPIRYDWSNR